MAAYAQDLTANDANTLLRLMLEDKRLAQYFHLDVRPEARTLALVNDTKTPVPAGFTTSLGQTVVPYDGHAAEQTFEVSEISTSDSKATVGFRYAVEGIVGTAEYARSGDAWRLEGVTIRER